MKLLADPLPLQPAGFGVVAARKPLGAGLVPISRPGEDVEELIVVVREHDSGGEACGLSGRGSGRGEAEGPRPGRFSDRAGTWLPFPGRAGTRLNPSSEARGLVLATDRSVITTDDGNARPYLVSDCGDLVSLMTGEQKPGRAAAGEVVCMAAGVADVLLSEMRKGVRRAGYLTKRSDLADLAQATRDDLKARGSLLLSRLSGGPEPAHLEVLARRIDPPVGGHA